MEDDLFGGIDLLDIIPLVVVTAVEKAPQYSNKKTVSRTGVLSGSDFVHELLNSGDEKRIYQVLRMKKETFLLLCNWFRQKQLLRDSRNTSIEQQVD